MTGKDDKAPELEVDLDAGVVSYLERMARLGLWGDTLQEVCAELILTGIRSAVADGLIPPRVYDPGRDGVPLSEPIAVEPEDPAAGRPDPPRAERSL